MRKILPLIILLTLAGCAPAMVPEAYNPVIDATEFTTDVTNPYFTLTPGTTWVYESLTEDGLERVETLVTDETRKVIGVNTVVVWDRVWLDGELIEDTKDWYAQDAQGNVWYFGEDSVELESGEVVSHAGSWEAGADGAKPGVIMWAAPHVGHTYKEEYYAGVAEDTADVLALNETVTVPAGTFTDCVKLRAWTPLEPNVAEHKYYCPEAGMSVLEVNLEDGQRLELISIER